MIPRRKYLVDGLYEALPRLERELIHEAQGRTPYNVLQHLILECADEKSLECILTEIKREIARMSESGSSTTVHVERRTR